MKSPFSFDGELTRPAYLMASTAVLFAQHLFTWLVFAVACEPLETPWWFWLNPLRALVTASGPLPVWTMPTAMILTLIVDGLLVALAFRRAQNARGYTGFAALLVAPILQAPVILLLTLAPRRREAAPTPAEAFGRPSPRVAVRGLLVGATLSVGAVLLSTLALHLYGYGLFIASPFVIGLTTAYLANRESDLGPGWTTSVVFTALMLGGVALIGFALEGVACLVLAAPLIAAMGYVGGLFGRALARGGRRRGGPALMSIAFVPLLLVGETALPPKAAFDSTESVDIAATPAAVWEAVVHMGPIPDAPAVPFRWGLAYPMRGEILGTGLGAIRRGVFSTGVAYERVTEWEPQRKLSFIVLSDPPTMRELSPYQHVNAPHVLGYFRTEYARFTITPLSDGKTRLSLATRHELDLEPALYWIPIAEWATHANKVRVLEHFRRQAEAAGGA